MALLGVVQFRKQCLLGVSRSFGVSPWGYNLPWILPVFGQDVMLCSVPLPCHEWSQAIWNGEPIHTLPLLQCFSFLLECLSYRDTKVTDTLRRGMPLYSNRHWLPPEKAKPEPRSRPLGSQRQAQDDDVVWVSKTICMCRYFKVLKEAFPYPALQSAF